MDVSLYKAKVTDMVANPMIAFIDEWGADGYAREDVEKCAALIHGYLDALAAMNTVTDDAIMEQVKLVVLSLNELNEATDFSLIETGEREAIWEIIQESAVERGLQNVPDDVTEEWREW